ncbi:hypothetical protein C4D60_Mb01t22390 [Musa balbisiana]|uniref:ADP/ATP translocase n=1 Tax=Musa balbisiana TaxID=52838 RepID=A0A4S8JP10_MUSBA|nr:hypothetical protein C4D60_Mb01t22390 [Musa balbisiana]
MVCWKPCFWRCSWCFLCSFVYSLDYARTRLANDAKAAKKGGERQFNGLIDVYRKTLQFDVIAGLYRGFNISCAGIMVYRGLYFGMYDSLKPVVLAGKLQKYVSFTLATASNQNVNLFALGWVITNGYGPRKDDDDLVTGCKYRSSLDAFPHILKN